VNGFFDVQSAGREEESLSVRDATLEVIIALGLRHITVP
jgi:hypothetical protein